MPSKTSNNDVLKLSKLLLQIDSTSTLSTLALVFAIEIQLQLQASMADSGLL